MTTHLSHDNTNRQNAMLLPRRRTFRRWALAMVCLLAGNLTAQSVARGEPSSWQRRWAAAQQAQHWPLDQAPEGLQRLATAIVIENLPSTYEDRRKWGMTRERFDGLHVRLDGLKVRTKRRRKRVNHGTWKRYQITQIDPQQHLSVHISPATVTDDGRAAFQVELACKINGIARLSEWNRGVRLFSMTVDADAAVRIVIDCRLDVQLDPSRLPPDLVLHPEVVDADIRLVDFRLNRLSHFDGPVVRELGSHLDGLIRDKIDEKRPKLLAKINRQIERHPEDLRISMHDALREKWRTFSTDGNPDDRSQVSDGSAKKTARTGTKPPRP